jgi:hypothetical protein
MNLTASKRFCFADPLLPFGTVWEANAHCTHLQIAQADPQNKICKRVQLADALNRSILLFYNTYKKIVPFYKNRKL